MKSTELSQTAPNSTNSMTPTTTLTLCRTLFLEAHTVTRYELRTVVVLAHILPRSSSKCKEFLTKCSLFRLQLMGAKCSSGGTPRIQTVWRSTITYSKSLHLKMFSMKLMPVVRPSVNHVLSRWALWLLLPTTSYLEVLFTPLSKLATRSDVVRIPITTKELLWQETLRPFKTWLTSTHLQAWVQLYFHGPLHQEVWASTKSGKALTVVNSASLLKYKTVNRALLLQVWLQELHIALKCALQVAAVQATIQMKFPSALQQFQVPCQLFLHLSRAATSTSVGMLPMRQVVVPSRTMPFTFIQAALGDNWTCAMPGQARVAQYLSPNCNKANTTYVRVTTFAWKERQWTKLAMEDSRPRAPSAYRFLTRPKPHSWS